MSHRVINAEEDVLVAFVAPWCAYCKALQPVLEELASFLSTVPLLSRTVVATMDCSKNEVPYQGLGIVGYPALYLFKSNGKDLPVEYDGERNVSSISHFLKSNINLI